MDDREKSIKILKAMGWHPVKMPKNHSEGWYRLADEAGNWDATTLASSNPDNVWTDAPNLYSPQNMAMAWKVLNWVDRQPIGDDFENYWHRYELWAETPEAAQRDWLDRIIKLLDKS